MGKNSTKTVYDCIVVGSGAAGGWAAQELATQGLSVLVLEAGPAVDPAKDFRSHQWPYESKFRGRLAPREQEFFPEVVNEYVQPFFVDRRQHPYTTPSDRPYDWTRARVVGGKTLFWGRGVPRYSDLNFKAFSQDGYGDDWPISYQDIEPHYDKVERSIGVAGEDIGVWHAPNNCFLKPFPLTCGEQLLRKGARKLGRRVVQFPTAVLSEDLGDRARCHFCSSHNCGRGCDSGAMFNSIYVTLPRAARTKFFTLRPNAIAREVTLDGEGKARGVVFVDRLTRETHEVQGKTVILGASCLESTRLLLNSRSREYPEGLANSSGLLGRYLHDHVMTGSIVGFAPQLYNAKVANDDAKPCGFYIPRFRNVETRLKSFVRGYQFSGGAGARMFPGFSKDLGDLFGTSLKREIRKLYPAVVSMTGFGESIPNRECAATLDATRVDAWGIPVLKISAFWEDNERRMAQDIAATAEETFRTAGFEVLSVNREMSVPGRSIHEAGTARMGSDPKTSVLNPFCQSHDVKNLFVVDGSCFVSSGNQNVTLTILALCDRACQYLVEQFKKGNV
ncbi:MAG: GMC family oxidoreductase [Acidimicrobiia bacterium]|nr:GMC family oxidoreductase [Acidimicrobiia bacterium]